MVKEQHGCESPCRAAEVVTGILLNEGVCRGKAIDTAVDIAMSKINPVMAGIESQFDGCVPQYDFSGLRAKAVKND